MDWPTLIATLIVAGVCIGAGYFAQTPSGPTRGIGTAA